VLPDFLGLGVGSWYGETSQRPDRREIMPQDLAARKVLLSCISYGTPLERLREYDSAESSKKVSPSGVVVYLLLL